MFGFCGGKELPSSIRAGSVLDEWTPIWSESACADKWRYTNVKFYSMFYLSMCFPFLFANTLSKAWSFHMCSFQVQDLQLYSVQYCNICPQASSQVDIDSSVSSDAGSSHVSQASAGCHITRSATRRMSLSHGSEGEVQCSPHLTRLKEEGCSSATSSSSFHFSPPTLVHGSAGRDGEYSSSFPPSSQKLYVFMYYFWLTLIISCLFGRQATITIFYSALVSSSNIFDAYQQDLNVTYLPRLKSGFVPASASETYISCLTFAYSEDLELGTVVLYF